MVETPKTPKKILVAEDDPAILRVISITLAKAGMTVLGAMDGEEAFHLAQRESLDAIVLDIHLPKIDGMTLCKKLKDNRHTAHIPIGFLTAQVESKFYEQARKLGGVLYMPKPFHPDRLTGFIQILLASRKHR